MSALAPVQPDFADRLAAELASANIGACLQCRKCTDGCPVAARADIRPHELVRMAQLGQRREVLTSRMIWECTSCQTCATRCPQKVDIAAMNDVLRRLSRAESQAAAGSTVSAFNDAFLRCVRRLGRVHEITLMTSFKLRTQRFMDDVGKVPMMLAKGKLALWPKSVRGGGARRDMFERIAQRGGRKP